MNFSDSEIVASILQKVGYKTTHILNDADLILLNTCSIRDKAEITIRNRLKSLNKLKKTKFNLKIGVLGCMAERLKKTLLEQEKIVDLVVGPDAYRDLPNLINDLEDGKTAINVLLSREETYSNINPTRLNSNGVNAFVSITRGCDNMCTFCVVPFTRGRERSRDPKTILDEISTLRSHGYKEVTLLGQNVDSYLWYGGGPKKDFVKANNLQKKNSIHFHDLLNLIALENPNIRIRFSTSNPQDMTIDVLHVMSRHKNICNHIHLPVQSGSNKILKNMNRQHTSEEYFNLINLIKKIIPNCAISHDMISGFPGETEQDHQDTISLMKKIKYNFGFMFMYSERPGTLAARKFKDNIPEAVKKRRLGEIIKLQQEHGLFRNKQFIGHEVEVLVEKVSKKSKNQWSGRTQQNSVVIFNKLYFKIGDYVSVKINSATSATLLGEAISYGPTQKNYE
jgi:tRNA-2-methylthio-N6-dimethylallyladenosine synthase